jgi:FkbM family methyltransferase
MSFISYAQNYEDVILWRAFKNITNGFYIDIGSQDPIDHSVSYAFSKAGWDGLSIEPTEQYYNKFKECRPNDKILQVAISNKNGFLVFYEFENTGLSTANESIAKKHSETTKYQYIKNHVPVISTDNLLNEHENKDIHWLKIDVEGFEKEVLQGWLHSKVRPWVLIIESTLPLTQNLSHNEWDNLVTKKGYEFVYFDGLNRFYVHSSQALLKHYFSTPPNVFDDFICHNELLLSTKLEHSIINLNELSSKYTDSIENIKKIEASVSKLEKHTHNLTAQINDLHQEKHTIDQALNTSQQNLHNIINSNTWKATKPIRLILHNVKKYTKVIIKKTLLYTFNLLENKPYIKQKAIHLIYKFPYIDNRLRTMIFNYKNSNNVNHNLCNDEQNLDLLSPYAKEIYYKLQQAIKNKQEEK